MIQSLQLPFLLATGAELDSRPPLLGMSYAERFMEMLRIRNRDGALAPFALNRAQRELARDPAPRKIILKARQLGISTYVAARFFIKTITQPGTLTVQVAHDQESAEEIFKIVRRFQENLPEALRSAGKSALARTSRSNVRQLVFPLMDSEYRVATAADPNAGRGLTIQNLHCSEVGRWPRFAAETLASLRAAVPTDGEIVLESTPNGAAGCFYNEWQRAAETGYSRHFFPWWYEPHYRIDLCGAGGLGAPDAGRLCPRQGEDLAREKADIHPLSEEEIKIMQRFGLDLEQIAYRRHLQSNFRGLAPQEFCEDAESCFLASGECVFDLETIEKRLAFCAQQYCEVRDNGALRIWYPPTASRSYLIGADPAGGGADGDYSCAQVLDLATGLQCAELRGHFPPMEFAAHLAALARDYNHALLVIERNNHGHAVLAHLQNPSSFVIPSRLGGEESASLNVHGFSRAESSLTGDRALAPEAQFETRNQKLETSRRGELNLFEKNGQLGWLTTAANRAQIIANFAATLATDSRLFNSAILLEECRTFIRCEDGRPAAAIGAHDDTVFAMAIALAARNEIATNSRS